MTFYFLFCFLITLAIFIAYLNHRFIHIQTTIATMISALMIALVLIILGQFGFKNIENSVQQYFAHIDFYNLLINGMLSFLLFAGALHINLHDLKQHRWEIGILASLGTVFSTFIIGIGSYFLLNWLNLQLPFIVCLLFGALISPTDPIAVLGIFRKLKAPRSLDAKLAGESLFNDGIGVVLFLTAYQVAYGKVPPHAANILYLFFKEAFGGILFGVLLGYIALLLIKPIKSNKMIILVTTMIVTGGYGVAQTLEISGPLAMVVAGIFLGNAAIMNQSNTQLVKDFWEIIDEILNALLFLLVGFEILIIPFHSKSLWAAAISIPLVLLARYLTVGIPMGLFKTKKKYLPHTINILTWGGLRGGLAIALALAIPKGHGRDIILTMTYSVVAFSIIVQGITIKRLVNLATKSNRK